MSNEPKTSRYLGIDYGQSHVGLSIADSETKIASRYGTLENDRDLLRKIAEIVERESIGKIIIGLPAYIKDEKKEYPYENFGKALSELMPEIEIEFANEMFSTKIAQANLIEKGVKGIKKHDHEEAARIILQGWMDNKSCIMNHTS